MAGHAAVGRQAVNELQAGPRSMDHGNGDGAVEGDHGTRGDGFQEPEQGEDLGPVGVLDPGGLVVDGGDSRLELVRAKTGVSQRIGDERDALIDELAVPPAAILVGERDQGSVRAGTCRQAGLGEQHQGEQAGYLAIAGQQTVQEPGEADRLAGEITAGELGSGSRRVALVEDEVQHLQHRRAAVRRAPRAAAG